MRSVKTRLTDMQKEAARSVASRMLLIAPCTLHDLVAAVRSSSNGKAGDPYRNFISCWMQILREDGCLVHERHGNMSYWSYTTSGRERLEAMARPPA